MILYSVEAMSHSDFSSNDTSIAFILYLKEATLVLMQTNNMRLLQYSKQHDGGFVHSREEIPKEISVIMLEY